MYLMDGKKVMQLNYLICCSIIGILILFLLKDILTLVTILVFLFSLLILVFRTTADYNRFWYFLFFLIVNVGYINAFGFKVHPEAATNLLIGIVSLKMQERQEKRDYFIIYFCFILILIAGCLFQKTLTYFIFVLVSFALLSYTLLKINYSKFHLKSGLKSLLFSIPLFFVLFIFFPRWYAPFISLNTKDKSLEELNQISLPDKLDFSTNQTLLTSKEAGFIAWIYPKKVNSFYWRSHVIIDTDGWNWMNKLPIAPSEFQGSKKNTNEEIHQQILIEYPQKQKIGLDYPIHFSSQNPKANSYEVLSFNNMNQLESIDLTKVIQRELTKHFLPENDQRFINTQFKASNVSLVVDKIRKYFREQRFVYQLNPKSSFSFQDFIKNREGHFYHYASSVALILRSLGYPTRVVVGYLGAEYNVMGNFYRVTQNYTHIWLEVFNEHQWLRVDPTLWIQAGRLNQNSFLEAPMEAQGFKNSFFRQFQIVRNAQMWFESINAQFYFWLENFNKTWQEEWALKLGLNIAEFYQLGGILALIFFSLLYLWLFLRQRTKVKKKSWKTWATFWDNLVQQFPHLTWGKTSEALHFFASHHDLELKAWGEKLKKMEDDLF